VLVYHNALPDSTVGVDCIGEELVTTEPLEKWLEAAGDEAAQDETVHLDLTLTPDARSI
jgi:hypothetical protein